MEMLATRPDTLSDVLEELDTIESTLEIIQRQAKRVMRATEALCIVVDYARGGAWSIHGTVESPSLYELVIDVASSGRRQTIGSTVVVPIGPVPARAVLVVRRCAPGYTPAELFALGSVTRMAAEELERYR
jgi:hypothetical protein